MRMSRRFTLSSNKQKPIVFFDRDNGGDQTAVTGGWNVTNASVTATQIGINTSGRAYPKNLYDLRNYKYLHCTTNSGNNAGMSIRDANNAVLATVSTPGRGTFDLNIEGYATNSCRPYFNTGNGTGAGMVIFKVWIDNEPTA